MLRPEGAEEGISTTPSGRNGDIGFPGDESPGSLPPPFQGEEPIPVSLGGVGPSTKP